MESRLFRYIRHAPPARARWIIFLVAWALSAGFVGSRITRNWSPTDDGVLGQTAERVLNGELPHKDFDDPYTGGLAALHALSFRLLGVRLVSMRVVLFVAFVLWVPALYGLANRFATPYVSAAVTFLGVAWSVPAYPASMPSWYNLFLATAGLLALCRYAETQRSRWLFAAGMCAGLSMLVKVTGVYFLVAATLFVLFQAFEPPDDLPRDSGATRARTLLALSGSPPMATALGIGAACAVVAALLWLVRSGETGGTYLHFVVPGAAVGAVVAFEGWRAERVAWVRLWVPSAMLGLGVVAVLCPVVVLYVHSHALGDLVRGVFILPARRLSYAVQRPPGRASVAAIPLIVLAVLSFRVRRAVIQTVLVGLISVIGAYLVVVAVRNDSLGSVIPSAHPGVYPGVVDSVRTILPIISVVFAAVMLSRAGRFAPRNRRQQAFAAVTVAALCALVAFPYSNDLYFFYVSPLVFIAVIAVHAVWGRSVAPWIPTATIAVYLLFAIVRVDVYRSAHLVLARDGLRVPAQDSVVYPALVATLRAHAQHGYTYATPDCPQVYFLAGLRNPTRTLFEMFDDTAGRTDRILALLSAHRVTAVVINTGTLFSGRPDHRLIDTLRSRYPDSATVGQYVVRWRP